MPIKFGSYTMDLITWLFIPDEVIDFTPFINASILIIKPGVYWNGLTIPSLKMFIYARFLSIQGKDFVEVVEYPPTMQSIELDNTYITTLDNLPGTVEHLILTNNNSLFYVNFPPHLHRLDCYRQSLDTIRITSRLVRLSLYRCTFNRIIGLHPSMNNNLYVLYIRDCDSPYPSITNLDHGDKSLIRQYILEMYKINRQLHVEECMPFVEMRIKAQTVSYDVNSSNALRAMQLQSNYPRRITEFIVGING
jgi:hypothetical protein